MAKEMPAGREMDKAIGQYIFKYWVDHYDKDCAENCYYCLIDGSGDAVIPGFYGERKSEEEAWADCPYKPGCTYGYWNLADWCERADQHYCGECYMTECEEAMQGSLFETID
jgi:hypothetical protein